MTKHIILAVTIIASAQLPGGADGLEIIDLMHLDATQFAASLAGAGTEAAGVHREEAVAFAVDAMHHAAERARGRSGAMQPIPVSRARSVPSGGQDLSHLLPEGLAGPPVAAPNRNALIARGSAEAIDELRELIAMLDVPTPMVNVELTWEEVGREAMRQIEPALRAWGWGGEASTGRITRPLLRYASEGLQAILGYEAGARERQATTAANVTGMSATAMVISAGEVRPWISSSVYYDPWGRRHVEYYPEAVFVGVTLWVLPTVHGDDTVTMVLRPVLSEAAGPAAQIGAGDVITRTLAETTVRVADGQPMVIGGMDRRLDELSRSFPASEGRVRSSRESVMTVTPTIVRQSQR
ncbi:MAG: type II secretion system protein GspD [Armatimonadota bacterium]